MPPRGRRTAILRQRIASTPTTFLPVRFEREVSRLAPAMSPHSALLEQRLRVAQHGGIAAEHRMRVLGSKWHAGPCFEPAVPDRVRNATRQRAAMCFAAHDGNEAEATGALAGDACERFGVGKIGRVPDTVNEHDAVELLPRLLRAEDREVGPQARAGGEAP